MEKSYVFIDIVIPASNQLQRLASFCFCLLKPVHAFYFSSHFELGFLLLINEYLLTDRSF